MNSKVIELFFTVLDMIRCRDWYGSDECILIRDEICQIIMILAGG